jgi:hypothetical protein
VKELNNKRKLISAVVLAVISICILAGAVIVFIPTQPLARVASPIVLPLPLSSHDNNSQNTDTLAPIQLAVQLSQTLDPANHFNFNITQGNTTTINVNLTSTSRDAEFKTPLYLSVGAFNNQPSPKIITSAPSPYPTLPWHGHEDSSNATKPFEAIFDSNPVTLAPGESKTVVLTITALENAQPGVYTMLLEMGNWKDTGLGGVTFQLTVRP